eukprot:4461969-Pyramimonas_sp.AAC.1
MPLWVHRLNVDEPTLDAIVSYAKLETICTWRSSGHAALWHLLDARLADADAYGVPVSHERACCAATGGWAQSDHSILPPSQSHLDFTG